LQHSTSLYVLDTPGLQPQSFRFHKLNLLVNQEEPTNKQVVKRESPTQRKDDAFGLRVCDDVELWAVYARVFTNSIA
jgi:hypothetical protein